MSLVYGWLASAAAFTLLDAVWLSQMTPRFYRPALGDLLAARPNFAAAAVFYLLYVTGVLVLAVLPAVEKGSLARALALGAFVGLMAYGTYDLTNHATLKDWPVRLSVVDIAWGTLLTSLSACAGYLAMRFAGS